MMTRNISFRRMRRFFDAVVLTTVSAAVKVWVPERPKPLESELQAVMDIQVIFFRSDLQHLSEPSHGNT